MNRVKVIFLSVAILLVVLGSACESRENAVRSSQGAVLLQSAAETEVSVLDKDVMSDQQAIEIVQGAIERGQTAQLLALAPFAQLEKSEYPPFYPVNYDATPQDSRQKEELAIIKQFRSTTDITEYFYNTFTTSAADKVLNKLFNNSYEVYRDIEGLLYINSDIGAVGFGDKDWDIQSIKIVENSGEKIVAEMETSFREDSLGKDRLILQLVKGKWLMDESFYSKVDTASNEQSQNSTQDSYREILKTFGAEEDEQSGLLKADIVSLYYDEEGWSDPKELTTGEFFSWYLTIVWKEDLSQEEQLEIYKSPFGEGTGWFFPQDILERAVQKYFDVPLEVIRADEIVYNVKYQGYHVDGGPGIGEIPKIKLDKTEEDGELTRLYITLVYGEGQYQKDKNMILTVKIAADKSYKYQSYLPQK